MKKGIYTLIAIVVVIGAIFIAQPSGDAGQENKIKIGVLIPLTGKFASYGEDVKAGLEIAKKDLGERGANVEFVYEDSAADPKVALQGANKLINSDKVRLIIAGPGSSANLAVAPIAESSKVLFFAISSTPKLNTAGDYTFKLQPDVDTEVTQMVDYMRSKGINRVGVIFDSTSETNVTANTLFIKLFTEKGGEVVSEGIDGKGSDYRSQLAQLKTKNVQALYLLPAEKISGLALKQANELELKQQVFGWSAIDGSEFNKAAGNAAEGAIITDLPFSCDSMETMVNYCAKYTQIYSDRMPLAYGTYAYDALKNIVVALDSDNRTSINASAQKIIMNAFTSKSYDGVSGAYTLDREGNLGHPNLVFRKLVEGKFVDLN